MNYCECCGAKLDDDEQSYYCSNCSDELAPPDEGTICEFCDNEATNYLQENPVCDNCYDDALERWIAD